MIAAALERGLNLRRVSADRVGVSFDETSTARTVVDVLGAFGVRARTGAVASRAASGAPELPDGLARTSPFLEHPTFHRYRSETEMMRYLRRLADKDLALDRTMIPLGSCTMKLNAATEMIPVTWPEFADIHPFAPAGADRRATSR